MPQSGRGSRPASAPARGCRRPGRLCREAPGSSLGAPAGVGGVAYLISEMSFSSVSHRAWVWGSAGPSMAGRQGWGGEGMQGADGAGTGIRCEWQWRLPPGGTRQVPASTPKGRGSTQPVLPAATHASNVGSGREGATHLRGWGGGEVGSARHLGSAWGRVQGFSVQGCSVHPAPGPLRRLALRRSGPTWSLGSFL